MAATIPDPTSKESYCFLVDWYDSHANLTRQYQLFWFPGDKTIEMYDLKQHRTFLKRTKSDLRLQELYPGAAVTLNARQLFVRAYGDEYTRARMERQIERTLLVITSAGAQLGQILDKVLNAGFSISRMRMGRLDGFGGGDGGGGRSVAVELVKASGVADLLNIADQLSSSGKSQIYASPSLASAQNEINTIFNSSSSIPRTAQFHDCSLAIIRPHAVNAGHTGKIISSFQKAGYEITDLQLFRLEKADAEEFLEVYKGVVPEYYLILDEITSGPLIAMEITRPQTSTLELIPALRDFAGPSDPELAKVLRPESVRAKYGVDKVKNGVHVTDLVEDGELEVQYFFRILSR
ncbi:Nucleoside diphosphate kinase 7 [Rhizophlyctis rosea]|uniref:Nucleoside diphosphate kinase n=1 Tax=Rhizophlyctis rosea TaxID=64517 RepID=A0AAD5SD60_9FUNG|nr:Nucleoside diphosphate kinase 7 [Rhizophlyctis rosea]